METTYLLLILYGIGVFITPFIMAIIERYTPDEKTEKPMEKKDEIGFMVFISAIWPIVLVLRLGIIYFNLVRLIYKNKPSNRNDNTRYNK